MMETEKIKAPAANASFKKDAASFFSFGQDGKGAAPFFQPKLTINQPDDPYEKEADAMADKVMRMSAPVIQTKCNGCEEEEEKNVQLKAIPAVQKQGAAGAAPLAPAAPVRPAPDFQLPLPSLLSPSTGPDFLAMRQPFFRRNIAHLWDADSALQVWQYNFDFFRRFGLSPDLSALASNFTAPFSIDSQLKAGNPTWWEITDRDLGTTSFTAALPLLDFNADFSPAAPAWFKTIFGGGKTNVQRKCDECEAGDEHKVQLKEASGQAQAGSGLESYISSLHGSGEQLPAAVRNFYEPRFGYDFSAVKIHTGQGAATSAQSINALAYTTGSNIIFNDGQYAPDTDSGKKLLGHELTHVVQQQNLPGQRINTKAPPAAKSPEPACVVVKEIFNPLSEEISFWDGNNKMCWRTQVTFNGFPKQGAYNIINKTPDTPIDSTFSYNSGGVRYVLLHPPLPKGITRSADYQFTVLDTRFLHRGGYQLSITEWAEITEHSQELTDDEIDIFGTKPGLRIKDYKDILKAIDDYRDLSPSDKAAKVQELQTAKEKALWPDHKKLKNGTMEWKIKLLSQDWSVKDAALEVADVYIRFHPAKYEPGTLITFQQTVNSGSSSSKIDILPGDLDPFYGMDWDANSKHWKAEIDSPAIRSAPASLLDSSAYLYDKPAIWPGGKRMFETVAVIAQTGEILGALRWGVGWGGKIFNAKEADCTDLQSVDFNNALERFYTAPGDPASDHQGRFDLMVEGFDTDKTTIPTGYEGKLDEIVTSFKTATGRKITVAGFADSTDKYQTEVSEKRARAVADYLIGKGISKDDVDVTGLGATWIRYAQGATESRNRRVQIRLHS